jgi:peptidoglycan hydrolase-like protein with peptidoglycan-binding domain
MLDIRTRSALLAGAFAVVVGPAFAQVADDPAAMPEEMQGETATTGMEAPAEQQAAPGQPEADSATISRIQEALNEAGHDAGPVDGIWGPQSRSAMQSFQQAQGMEPTGLVNLRALEALGLGDVAADLQGTVGTGGAGMGEPLPGAPGTAQPAPTPGVGEPAPGVGEPAPGVAEPRPEPAPGMMAPGTAEPAPGVQPPQPGVPPTAGTEQPGGPPAAAQQTQPGAPLPDSDPAEVGGSPDDGAGLQ